MLVLIIIMLFSFLTTAILVQPNLIDMSKGIIPGIPDGSMVLIIAFIASCFSLVGAFYQSYLVQERKNGRFRSAKRHRNAWKPGRNYNSGYHEYRCTGMCSEYPASARNQS